MAAKGIFSKAEIKARIFKLRAESRHVPADYNLASFIVSNALGLQYDKAGAAYSHHVEAVGNHHTDSETKKIIGKLHDLVEDSDWTLEDLRELGFSERLIAGVDGMTCRPGEPYFDFVARCSLNPDSLDVKLKDLHHNLTLSRNNFLMGAKDLERINKYILSYNYLIAVKKGEIAPGSSVMDWMKAQPNDRLKDEDLVRRHSSPPPSALPASTPPASRP